MGTQIMTLTSSLDSSTYSFFGFQIGFFNISVIMIILGGTMMLSGVIGPLLACKIKERLPLFIFYVMVTIAMLFALFGAFALVHFTFNGKGMKVF